MTVYKSLMPTAKMTVQKSLLPSAQDTEASLPSCSLQWKQDKLWVSCINAADRRANQLALMNKERLIDCLLHSPIRTICLDVKLGEVELKHWANAGEWTRKRVLLQIPSASELPAKQRPVQWHLKRILDCIAAVSLLFAFSPVMLGLALLIWLHSPGPIFFQQWRVGQRGRLFKIYKFRTMIADAEKMHHLVMGNQQGLHKCKDDPRITSLGRFMRKYSLDELPQLFNVIRGEMSLVGPRPWALYDAVRINTNLRKRLNALPGITGPWQVQARSNLLDLESVNYSDLEYLGNWSLWTDLKILLLTVPKVLSGFGAY